MRLESSGAGSKKFADTTTGLASQGDPNNRFAIVLDSEVVSAPSVDQPVTGGPAAVGTGRVPLAARRGPVGRGRHLPAAPGGGSPRSPSRAGGASAGGPSSRVAAWSGTYVWRSRGGRS